MRAYLHLSEEERDQIAAQRAAGRSLGGHRRAVQFFADPAILKRVLTSMAARHLAFLMLSQPSARRRL